jgi:hypothetical protein
MYKAGVTLGRLSALQPTECNAVRLIVNTIGSRWSRSQRWKLREVLAKMAMPAGLA